ncbi:MAG: transcriptional regulator [Chloroflexi bacterium]|nr:transcriptional regulator [Chloroflexota bacterium]
MTHKQAITLRSKKLGVLLLDARLAAGKSKKECGQAIGVTSSTIGSYERGVKSPSLPELEILAFFLGIPIEHFWGDEIKSDDPHPTQNLHVEQLLNLRKGIIGALLRQARSDANLSRKDISQQTGISSRTIKKYETGERPIPLPELETLSISLNYTLQEFSNHQGPVSDWISEQRAIQGFLSLPIELKEFVGKPINHPYVELAQRLSEMSVAQLRSVAEGLLEITL